MNPQRIGVAVVGLGVGEKHLQAFAELGALFDVRAVCDLDAARAAAVARQFGGVRYTTDLAELLADPGLRLVDLCTPPQTHLALMRQVLDSGRDVVCEKPLVTSLADLDTLEAAARGARGRVFPLFQVRWGHGFRRLRHLQRAGFGRHALVATVETHWRRDAGYYRAPWRGTWAGEGGGVCLTQAIHAHDLLLQALGPVARVHAALATRVNAVEVEDCAAVVLQMADGALATLSATLGAAVNRSRLKFVFGDFTATGEADNPYRAGEEPWRFEAATPAAQAAVDEALASFVPGREGFAGFFEEVHGALMQGGEAPVTLADARASLELVTAIYHAAECGQAVVLPLAADDPRRAGWSPASGGFARRLAAAGPPGAPR